MAEAPVQEFMWDEQNNMVEVWWAYFNEVSGFVDQSVTTTSSPIFSEVTTTTTITTPAIIVDDKDMMKWAVLQG